MKAKLFGPREKFLILEITPTGTSGLFLSVDEERNVLFEKLQKNINLKKFLKSPVYKLSQKTWEGQYLFNSHRKVIVSADPQVATTIPIPLELKREAGVAKYEITVPELENLIAQAMAKIFTGCRGEASRRLGIDDLHTILVGAKAKFFKVDGKSVVNPWGFTGKKISLLLELTFTKREIFEELAQFFSSPDDFFFAEGPHARLFSIGRARKLPLNLIVLNEDNASLFVLQKAESEHPVLYREKFDWSFGPLFRAITKEFGVSDEAAHEMYRTYLKGEMSDSAKRFFKKTIQPHVENFLAETGKAKLQGSIYVDAVNDLPFEIPYKNGGATFEYQPVAELLAQLGFTAEFADARTAKNDVLRPLLYFLEAYFDRSNSEINQKLRRRLHWLAS